jgi:hypothetical protein
MSTRDDIAIVYAMDCTPPVTLPAWASLPYAGDEGVRRADGWRVIAKHHAQPERRVVPSQPVLVARGSRLLPRQCGWLFAARGR